MILKAQFKIHPEHKSARKELRKFGNIHIEVVLKRWIKSVIYDATMQYGGPRWCFLRTNTEEMLELFRHGNDCITVEIAWSERNSVRITCECWSDEGALWAMKELLTAGDEYHTHGFLSVVYGNPSIQQQIREGAITIQNEETSEEVIKLLMQ